MKNKIYFGDIHNHCNISYGHGPLKEALDNAKLQLDIVSVTGHSFWPDIPEPIGRMKPIVDYHVKGFNKLEKEWPEYNKSINQYNDPGNFVTFSSYEMHSFEHGDYVIYSIDGIDKMVKPHTFEEVQGFIREKNSSEVKSIMIPHHIGYKQGFRGINWKTFNEDVSPVVEIISMHGCSESEDAPFSSLHTMGPRNYENTMQAGLEAGHHFGIIGSTDHHSAHPGSYGHGVMAVLSESLTRESIWDAIINRRTYAISGDKIELDFLINNKPMGSISTFESSRNIKINVKGNHSIDKVELLKNNRVLKRLNYANYDAYSDVGLFKGKFRLELGWGEKNIRQDWNVRLQLEDGSILSSEPHFHGIDVVEPNDKHGNEYQFTRIKKDDNSEFSFTTSTWGNPTTTTNSNQAVTIELEGNKDTKIKLDINGKEHLIPISGIIDGSVGHFLGGFISGSYRIGRFIPESEYKKEILVSDISEGDREDFYYVRIAQKNNQWAWSSPIWIKKREE
ncbi:MAG: DUF3604 domain-containing protein [Spirochaetaceae bacterium]